MTTPKAPLLTIDVSDPSQGLHGFVRVDTLWGGKAMGGTRMTSTVDGAEVAGLASKMTLKLALAELPIGGAKAGIQYRPELGFSREHVIEAFGRAVAPLLKGGIYLGTDMGMTYADRARMYSAASYDVCRDTEPGKALKCSWSDLWQECQSITGAVVAEGTDAVARGAELRNSERTVSIQGYGVVGRNAALRLQAQGYRIVAVADRQGTIVDPRGLSLEQLNEVTSADGIIDRSKLPASLAQTGAGDAWLDVDAGVLVLAAGGTAIHAGNVGRVRARVIGEGANSPCSAEALAVLAERKVKVAPDIVINTGGAAVTALVLTGLAPVSAPLQELKSWLFTDIRRRVVANLELISRRALDEGRPMTAVAMALAAERVPRSA